MTWGRRRDLFAPQSERGSALLLALLVTAMLSVLSTGLVFLSITERSIAAHHRAALEARYAAAAVVERAIDDLQQVPGWSVALSGAARSSFFDLSPAPLTPSGVPVNVVALTAALQAQSDRDAGRGPDNPRWRVFASGPLGALVPPGTPVGQSYVLAWVADDVAEADGFPQDDSNGILQVWGAAIGPGQTISRITATLAEVAGGAGSSQRGVRLLSWRAIQ